MCRSVFIECHITSFIIMLCLLLFSCHAFIPNIYGLFFSRPGSPLHVLFQKFMAIFNVLIIDKKLTFIWNNFFAPVLIQKMVNKSKQLEAVKFIQALNIAHKYPLLPIMRSYIDHAAVAGKMIRIRGDDLATQVHLCCSILYYKHYTIKVVGSSWFLNYLYTLAERSWCKRAHTSWNIAEVH